MTDGREVGRRKIKNDRQRQINKERTKPVNMICLLSLKEHTLVQFLSQPPGGSHIQLFAHTVPQPACDISLWLTAVHIWSVKWQSLIYCIDTQTHNKYSWSLYPCMLSHTHTHTPHTHRQKKDKNLIKMLDKAKSTSSQVSGFIPSFLVPNSVHYSNLIWPNRCP